MLTDHIGAAFGHHMPYSAYLLCRFVGRLAMPLFCFMVAEGLFHTKDAKRYLMRLAIFALVSEVPFDLLFTGSLLEFRLQNVGFTLFSGLLGILLFDSFAAQGRKGAALAAILAAGAAAYFIRSDYTVYGVYFIFIFYYFRGNHRGRTIALAAGVLLLSFNMHLTPDAALRVTLDYSSAAAVLAAIPIGLYNGEKGREGRHIRAAFYAFYPAHLLALYAVKLVVG
jgi:hypothetical protein